MEDRTNESAGMKDFGGEDSELGGIRKWSENDIDGAWG